MNNRVFTYEVCGVDKHLNRTESVTLAPVKVSHDGSMDKAAWTAKTNMTADGDAESGDEDSPCEPGASSAIDKVIDAKAETVYTGATAGSDATVTISFNETLSVTGLKYRAPAGASDAIGAYEVQASVDGTTWETVKSGTFALDETGSATVYFNKEGDSWLYTYDAAYLRLVAKGARSASIAELDVLGQTGDDIDFIEGGIGLLANEIDLGGGSVVPAGSLVFAGTYKGNSAYNAVKLYDGEGNLIGGTQVLFAEVPEHGELGETADGRWLYYIEPDEMDELLPAGVPDTVRVSVLGVEALGTSCSDLSADAPEDPIDLALNSSKDDGDADGDGGSGSEGGSAGQSGDGGSGSGSGGAGSAGGSAGSNPDRGSSSDQGGSAGPLATTGDPLNSIALAIGVIAAASCAAVALAAVSLRSSAREDN